MPSQLSPMQDIALLVQDAYKAVLHDGSARDADLLIEEPELRLEERRDSMGELAYYVDLQAKQTEDYETLVEVASKIAEILREKLDEKGDTHYVYFTLNDQA